MNRKWMSKADTSTWTPLEYIAEYVQIQEKKIENFLFFFSLFYKWINDPSSRPNGGSVVKLTTTNGNTELSYH
jgi:dihydropteridine reductase